MLPDLDPVIHVQARLQLMTTLCALPPGDRIAIPRLQALHGLSAGNLSTHVRKLEDAGYVAVEKAFHGRRPVTWVTVTAAGRDAFDVYLDTLQTYLDASRAPRSASAPRAPRSTTGGR